MLTRLDFPLRRILGGIYFVIKESYVWGTFTSSSLEDPDSGDQDEVTKLLSKNFSTVVHVALWIPAV